MDILSGPSLEDLLETSVDFASDTGLEERADGGTNPWGLVAGAAMTLDAILSDKVDADMAGAVGGLFNLAQDAFACGKCFTCLKDPGNEDDPCCGCFQLDYIYGISDIPDCPDCDEPNTDGGGWPGSGLTLGQKRDLAENDDAFWLPEGASNDTGHSLVERIAGTATLSTKPVSVCLPRRSPQSARSKANGLGRYPAFPADASYPWDGIDDGAWVDVSTYWGNTSADCADWSVGALAPADTRYIGAVQTRAPYQSEFP